MDTINSTQTLPEGSERRKLFRVDDTAILEVLPLESENAINESAESQVTDSTTFKLMRDLRGIDNDGSTIFRTLHDRHPDIAAYLSILNKKIDVIGRSVAETVLGTEDQLQAIDLSEGGIGFNHPDPLKVDSTHVIKVWFNQTLIGLAAFIRVVGVHRAIDGGYRISASFINLPESEQQIISKHILFVQARTQREKRQEQEE